MDFLGRMLFLEHSPATIVRILARTIFDSLRPESIMRAQAVAFLMFLVFFPTLLFLVGAVALLVPGWEELLEDFRQVLPAGSRRAVVESLRLASMKPAQLLWTGGLGMLLLGTQFMSTLTRVFGMIYGRKVTEKFWRGQVRSLAMVLVAVVPWVLVGVSQVFGKWVRGWLVQGWGVDFNSAWQAVSASGYFSLVFLTATIVVATLFHFLTPGRAESWNKVMPGAVLAMLLWWVVSSGFGFYVRNIAFYDALYGGFAATIGLLVWMFLSAWSILVGARFNAELEECGAGESNS